MKADKKTIEAYDKTAKIYGDTRTINFWESELKKFMDYLPSGKVLDVGCGTGRDTRFLKKKLEYVGIDASESMLEYARSKNPKAYYENMDFYNLDFDNESFDGFWACASVLHVPKKEISTVLNEMSTARPGIVGIFNPATKFSRRFWHKPISSITIYFPSIPIRPSFG